MILLLTSVFLVNYVSVKCVFLSDFTYGVNIIVRIRCLWPSPAFALMKTQQNTSHITFTCGMYRINILCAGFRSLCHKLLSFQ